MNTNRTEELKKIRDEVIGLTASPLYEYRTRNNYHAVLGEGSHNAEIMFVGEAPGKNEAERGIPFCGAAGKILDELLASIGIKRAEVYITNIVKDRPPENRDPLPSEISLYGPFLDRQIEIIQPKIIATLGRFSMNYIFQKFGLPPHSISKVHGKKFNVAASYGEIIIIPFYHPAAAIYDQRTRGTHFEDFKTLIMGGTSPKGESEASLDIPALSPDKNFKTEKNNLVASAKKNTPEIIQERLF